jgi:hypothetical protein
MSPETLLTSLRSAQQARYDCDGQQRKAESCVTRLQRELAEAEAELRRTTQQAATAWAREDEAFERWHAAVRDEHLRIKNQRHPAPSSEPTPA